LKQKEVLKMRKSLVLLLFVVILVSVSVFATGYSNVYGGAGVLMNQNPNIIAPIVTAGLYQSVGMMYAGVSITAIYPEMSEVVDNLPIKDGWLVLGNIGLNSNNFVLAADVGFTTLDLNYNNNIYPVAGITEKYIFINDELWNTSISFNVLFPYFLNESSFTYPILILGLETSM